MELIRSNRTEVLAGALTSVVRSRPLSPFDEEVIVVQGQGVARWLTLFLAERLGVWSNPCFPFPRTAIEWTLEDLGMGDEGAARAFEPARLLCNFRKRIFLCKEQPKLGLERGQVRVSPTGKGDGPVRICAVVRLGSFYRKGTKGRGGAEVFVNSLCVFALL